jgi:pyruvate dehydrogenase E2 component (dihydrolipoamide acetyltransferase)
MSVDIRIPRFSANVQEVRLVEWKAKEGEWVEKGRTILVIETEKVTWEVETESSGFLHIMIREGQKVEVGMVVGVLAEAEEELAQMQKLTHAERPIRKESGKDVSSAHAVPPIEKEAKRGTRVRITPVARKIAKEHGIEITDIEGTGPGGKIVRKDVEKVIQAKTNGGKILSPYQGRRVLRADPLKGIRQSIAEHMYHSLSSSAQMTVMGEFDMTEIVRFREKCVLQEESIGVRISYVEIMVATIAKALKVHPSINCSLIDNELIIWEDINIGVAVALGEEALIVPVVKNADQKSLIEISCEVKELTKKAQEKTLVPDEVTGGTFTLTTVGRRGESRFQTPILNEPEAAILGIGPIEERAVVRDGQIVIRPIMPYSLTFDHRVVNGFGAEQFMGKIREFVENPSLLMLY